MTCHDVRVFEDAIKRSEASELLPMSGLEQSKHTATPLEVEGMLFFLASPGGLKDFIKLVLIQTEQSVKPK